MNRDTEKAGLQAIARIGYAAHGSVYLIIGGLALLAAFGRGRTVGARGALEALLAQPLGQGLLWAITVGFLCFACWRGLQSLFDADRHGTDFKGLLRRAALAGAALFHLALAGLAISVALHSAPTGDEDKAARDWTAWLLAQPLGAALTFAIGIGFVIAGAAFAIKGIRADFRQRLFAAARARRWIVRLGRFGFVARGVVFALIGVFLMTAAIRFNSGEAAGLAGALRSLQHQPYGWILLGITALGLVSFGVFEIMQAMFRRVSAPSVRAAAKAMT
jgi:Domain of Unknown Function (DUF1206)